ncbi:MAG: DUF962 domain-containing protein [Hahellaceae bacterium]|jgi:uncharacterized membrane protein YGL010W|nr:DUF962 domain-containing protein [Hahellaceae bacterium]
MLTLTQHLSQYAAYHRDRRNIATHFVGIPMIVFAVIVLLSRPAWSLGVLTVTPALLVSLVTTVFYLKLDLRYGLVMGILLALGVEVAAPFHSVSTTEWLSWGLGLFFVGWVIQFIGHYYEGKKPAFVDDLIGLVIGPLFVVAELGFILKMRREIEHAITHNVGPTYIRDLSAPQSQS